MYPNWVVLSDEQMSKRWTFSLLNDEQMSNKVRVEHQPAKDPDMSQERDFQYIILFWGWDVSTINPRGLDSGLGWYINIPYMDG